MLYQLAAISEFEKAIELSENIDLKQLLMPPVMLAGGRIEEPIRTTVKNAVWLTTVDGPLYQPIYEPPLSLESPTVGELLTAIGADDFEGKAHNMLGPLYLDRGSLKQAEQHMDAAVALKMNVLDGYRRLADGYEERGQHGDAFRANLKAMCQGGCWVGPAWKAMQNLGKALTRS